MVDGCNGFVAEALCFVVGVPAVSSEVQNLFTFLCLKTYKQPFRSLDCFDFLHNSPSLPQPFVGQRVECIGFQTPDPVVESRTQDMSRSHLPQQHSPARLRPSATSRPSCPRLSMIFSLWQSRAPGWVQGWPRVGGIG